MLCLRHHHNRFSVKSRNPHPPVVCQGPPPPNPLVVERFQGVVSQLFQQVWAACHAACSLRAVPGHHKQTAHRTGQLGLLHAPASRASMRRGCLAMQAAHAPEVSGRALRVGCELRLKRAKAWAFSITRRAPRLLLPGRWPLCVLQRIVRLGGAVDDDMANLLVAQLLYLDAVDVKKDITMYVNSPGGSVTAGQCHTCAANAHEG